MGEKVFGVKKFQLRKFQNVHVGNRRVLSFGINTSAEVARFAKNRNRTQKKKKKVSYLSQLFPSLFRNIETEQLNRAKGTECITTLKQL